MYPQWNGVIPDRETDSQFHKRYTHKFFVQLFSSYMYIVKAAKTTFIREICTFNVDEIDTELLSLSLR